MRLKLFLLLPLALHGEAALADDQPVGVDAFRRQADRINELHAAELDQKIARLRSDIAAETAKAALPQERAPSSEAAAPKPKPVFRLREIGGVTGQLSALILRPDGVEQDARPGDIVPGLGRVTAVTVDSVELDGRRRLSLRDGE